MCICTYMVAYTLFDRKGREEGEGGVNGLREREREREWKWGRGRGRERERSFMDQ